MNIGGENDPTELRNILFIFYRKNGSGYSNHPVYNRKLTLPSKKRPKKKTSWELTIDSNLERTLQEVTEGLQGISNVLSVLVPIVMDQSFKQRRYAESKTSASEHKTERGNNFRDDLLRHLVYPPNPSKCGIIHDLHGNVVLSGGCFAAGHGPEFKTTSLRRVKDIGK